MGRLFQKLPSTECLVPPSSEAFTLAIGSSQPLEKTNYFLSPPAPSCSKARAPSHPLCPCAPPRNRGLHLPSPQLPRRWSCRQPCSPQRPPRRPSRFRSLWLQGLPNRIVWKPKPSSPGWGAAAAGGGCPGKGVCSGGCRVPACSFLVAKEHFTSSAICA